jgi:hypothetical protein
MIEMILQNCCDLTTIVFIAIFVLFVTSSTIVQRIGRYLEKHNYCDENYARAKITTNRPSSTSDDPVESKLGVWLNNQIRAKNEGKLSDEMVDMLDTIDDEVVFDENWEMNLSDVKEFMKRSSAISKDRIEERVRRQTSVEYKGKMPEESDVMSNEEVWNKACSDAKEFMDHGQSGMPSHGPNCPIEKRMDKWLEDQIAKKKNDKMPDERLANLNSSPDFDLTNEDVWDTWCSEAKEFIESNKKKPSHVSTDLIERRLANWLTHQISAKNNGKLSDDRLAKLNSIPGWDSSREELWDEKFSQVMKFVADRGKRPSFGSVNPTEKRLAKWLSHQISAKNKGKLSDERLAKLNSIHEWDSPLVDEWDKKFSQATKFVANYGKRPSLGSVNPTEKRLANWFGIQIMMKNKGKLSEERLAKLNSIPDFIVDE